MKTQKAKMMVERESDGDASRKLKAKMAASLALIELDRAWSLHPRPQASLHEGYAILKEEVDELWQAIKHGTRDEAHEEAVQVAAMAIRLLVEMD